MLEKFGLTPTEEKVYLALFKLGLSPAADIIKKTQLHRSTIYDVLGRLIEKGLVSYITQNKIKYYSAANPSKFLDIAFEEKKEAEEKKKLAKEIISKIKVIEKDAKNKPLAQIFVGNKGLKSVMNDIIETKEDFVEFGVEGKFEDTLPTYTAHWAKQRRKKNIKAKIICTEGSQAPKWEMNKIKFVPKEYQSPATTLIYGDKVSIFIEEEPILIILIESKKLAQ
ncbi:MAG: helix-turn-helix domain-containing protein, partial [bacterium]|nr:helix-turn-helix domain-containing protein [bacterium]